MGKETRQGQKMNVLIGIQARTNSTRFPNKIYQPLGDISVLERVYNTCKRVDIYQNVLTIKTYVLPPYGDKELEEFCHQKGFDCIKCPEQIKESDVVSRYDYAMGHVRADFMIRITADCPLIESSWIKSAIVSLMDHDYVSNTLHRTVMDGHDVQGITAKGWMYYMNMVHDYEHVFRDIEQDYHFRQRFLDEGYKVQALCSDDKTIVNPYHPETKISLDTKEDYERIKIVYERLHRKG